VAEKNGLAIGVKIILKQNGYANSCYIGIDHKTAGNDFTYFNLGFYATIKEAIRSNIKRIDYGNGMYSVKIDRGCHLTPTYLFYKPEHFLQRVFIPLWFRFHAFWFERKLSDRMRAHLMVME
jgi:predicted N-acyltransferase